MTINQLAKELVELSKKQTSDGLIRLESELNKENTSLVIDEFLLNINYISKYDDYNVELKKLAIDCAKSLKNLQ